MKKRLFVALAAALVLAGGLAGAGCREAGDTWTVINREAGSGTRDVFREDVLAWTDETGQAQIRDFSLKAEQYTSNEGVLQAISTIDNGIGYVSLGYLPADGVCAITLDGIECTAETVLSGAYPLSRSLYFVTKGEASEAEKAFLYWCQHEGQENTDPYLPVATAVEQYGYAPRGSAVPAKAGASPGSPTGGWNPGSLQEGGSTTVLPLAEAWAEEYKARTGRGVVTNGGGSYQGAVACHEGSFDIGALSRDLTAEETGSWGLVPYDIALDGVAVVVSRNVCEELGITDLSMEQLRSIFIEGSGTPVKADEGDSGQAGEAAAFLAVGLASSAFELSPPVRRKGRAGP